MFPELKIEHLKTRAKLLQKIRKFMDERNITEVETPLLSSTTVSDPYIQSFSFDNKYLQTSPEFLMKRLLAAGSGDIYQICKSFRAGENGRRHNNEFTMLEWYRVGFDHHQLIDEVDQLLQNVLSTKPANRVSYQNLFKEHLQIDPLDTTIEELKSFTTESFENMGLDDWLQYLMSEIIEPKLENSAAPWVVYDFPAGQAALSIIEGKTSQRFEFYHGGLELANGYHELCDSTEQLRRINEDNMIRSKNGLPEIEPDHKLLHALDNGFPKCAGVAIGVDRLLMLAAGEDNLPAVCVLD